MRKCDLIDEIHRRLNLPAQGKGAYSRKKVKAIFDSFLQTVSDQLRHGAVTIPRFGTFTPKKVAIKNPYLTVRFRPSIYLRKRL